jgi:hypothetical protein
LVAALPLIFARSGSAAQDKCLDCVNWSLDGARAI